nr:hypothetical protein 18 [bacterium]
MTDYELIPMLLTRLAAKSNITNKLYLDQNPPLKSHWTYKLFHNRTDPQTNEKLKDPKNWVSFKMNPADNLDNLSKDYIDALETLPERQRRRFLLGEYQDEIEGALWSDSILDRNRIDEPPIDLVRVVIGVDPAVTTGPNADETGIVVAGINEQEHFFVLDDRTGKYTPFQWASMVAKLYYQWSADRVVGEGNNGGDLVASNVRTVDPDIKVDIVHATRGKLLRAEPIAGLYEQNRVHHVGRFNKLEDQQTHFTGEPGQQSPNNLDAAVWALTALMKRKKQIQFA